MSRSSGQGWVTFAVLQIGADLFVARLEQILSCALVDPRAVPNGG